MSNHDNDVAVGAQDSWSDADDATIFGIQPDLATKVAGAAAVVVAALTVLVILLEDVTAVLVRGAALVLLVGALWAARREFRSEQNRWMVLAQLALAAFAAAVLVAASAEVTTMIGRIIGAIMLAAVAGTVLNHRRSGALATTGFAWATAIAGVALVVAPDAFARTGVLIAAVAVCASVIISTMADAGLLDLSQTDTADPMLVRWLIHNAQTNKSRAVVIEEFYFEGAAGPGRMLRFVVLMACAAGIATMGVLTDSTAVVIGAMLVAPLITPMMGMGLALTMGWPRRLFVSSIAVLIGAVIAIGIGAVLPAALGTAVDLTSNSQIISRTSPTVADLIIAVIAGATGAYANARRDVASSLPGVAIAIALVPPLAVVGVTAQRGAWDLAAGTLLLFLTNLAAILLVGGAVFLITGVAPVRLVAKNSYRVRTATATVAVLGIVIVGALLVNGRSIARDSLAQDGAENIVSEWLGEDSDLSVVSVTVDDDTITVVLVGPGDPPDLDGLLSDVDDEFDRPMIVDVQWVARDRQVLKTD